MYTMNHAKFIVSYLMEEPIRILRVKGLCKETSLPTFASIGSWLDNISQSTRVFKMNCLLSYISISTWGTIKNKNNIYLSRFIQGLHNGV